jgi:OmpR family response regulator RpaB
MLTSDIPQILVVDDDPSIVSLIRQILEEYEDAGVDILEARDGNSALQLIHHCQPNLIFLDLNLGGDIHGGIVCQVSKQHLDIPIVVVTALDQDDPKIPFEADVHIVKPFSADQILAVARQYLPIPV